MRLALAASVLLGAAAVAAAPAARPPSAGERAYQKCYSCHALEPGKNDLQGPTLHRIADRPVANQTGYDYSPALRRWAKANPRWTPALLDRFVADPEALVPGTSMHFVGLRNAKERAELIEFLGSDSSPHVR